MESIFSAIDWIFFILKANIMLATIFWVFAGMLFTWSLFVLWEFYKEAKTHGDELYKFLYLLLFVTTIIEIIIVLVMGLNSNT